MNLLEEKNRLAVENTTLRHQLDEIGNRMKKFDYGCQNTYVPPIMPNGDQVLFSTSRLFMPPIILYHKYSPSYS